MSSLFPNPIEIFSVRVVQPIINFLGYLLQDVHYVAFLAAVALLGIFLGLVFGIICVIWYKTTRDEKSEKKVFRSEEGVGVGVKKNE